MSKKVVETPLMRQYLEMKRRHPDAVLLFRVGDFYETFSDDAITASHILGITLTRRANGSASHVELAGFPHHALDTYLPKLVRAGKRVAICEQLEDPKLTKKLVKRGITELVTPGLNMSETLQESTSNSYVAAIVRGGKRFGVAFLDLSTGEFLYSETDFQGVDKLIASMRPKEVVTMRGEKRGLVEEFRLRMPVFEMEDWVYSVGSAMERLTRHFGTSTMKGYGLGVENENAMIAAGSLLYYLDETEHRHLAHITSLGRIEDERYVRLDTFTIRNLELFSSSGEDGASLSEVLDRTRTPMGARLLRRNLAFPLLGIEEIEERLDRVECVKADDELREELVELLGMMGDTERLGGKIGANRAGPRDLVRLWHSLDAFRRVKKLLTERGGESLKKLADGMDSLDYLHDELKRSLCEDAPLTAGQGNAIASGVNGELDELRDLLHHNKEGLDRILAREISATGIGSLKIGFNNVFGYYIEVRNAHREKVPEGWMRKQTLVNAERYITPELKEYEQRILGAQDRISALEVEIFGKLLEMTIRYVPAVLRNSSEVAKVDVALSNATVANENDYVRPEVDDSRVIDIKEGRHPVIEQYLPAGERYVSNSVRLDSDGEQILMITGPNMSGKSALLRQTALIVLMAQAGCYVPADRARIGIVDKIFTRVGASDNISRGESTFMVEMTEAASILNNMSDRSLILFDELGRGTSTYDGISIAWAIVENIHENGVVRPRMLFATHYHELNEMADSYGRIANYNVSVAERNGSVTFLRKLQRGGSEHSFGIHVARIAGVPPSIVRRAQQVLRELESGGGDKGRVKDVAKSREGLETTIFQLDDPLLSDIRERILDLDIDNLTPLQSLTILHGLRGLLTGREEG